MQDSSMTSSCYQTKKKEEKKKTDARIYSNRKFVISNDYLDIAWFAAVIEVGIIIEVVRNIH